MSILIKGMEMPKSCEDCRLSYTDQYGVTICAARDDCAYSVSCPLVHLPEGHGRLIDADLMVEGLMKCAKNPPDDDQESRWFYLFASEIAKSCPTIVPAEGGNADG